MLLHAVISLDGETRSTIEGLLQARVAHLPILAIRRAFLGRARVAELVDALDLGSSIERCGGSTPSARTMFTRS